MRHTVCLLVENKPRVMQRVVGVIAKRGYNIESIAVGPTEMEDISRITLILNGDDKVLEQVTKQMNKLIDVIKVSDISPAESILRELCLVKVGAKNAADRSEVMRCSELFGARVIDVSPETVTIELSSSEDNVSSMVRMLRSYGIKEVVRTGVAAISKGSGATAITQAKGGV